MQNAPTAPAATAADVLRAALAAHGLTAYRDECTLVVPLDQSAGEDDMLTGPHVLISDAMPSVDYPAGDHTGWLAWHCDANGEPIGDAVHDGSAPAPVDCATDSAAAAAAVAALLSRQ